MLIRKTAAGILSISMLFLVSAPLNLIAEGDTDTEEVGLDDVEDDYDYSFTGNEVTITSYLGTDTDVVIPSYLGGMKVTRIGRYAFENRTGIESIVIPDTVTTIVENAFYGCRNLESINIPASVTSVKNRAFYNCEKLTSAGPAGSGANIEYEWEKIPAGAFQGDNRLVSVTLPEGQGELGNWTFSDCYALSEVNNTASLTKIGTYVFNNCQSLEEIDITEAASIGESAFRKCTALDHLAISNTLATVGESAFSGCPDALTVDYYGSKSEFNGIQIAADNNSLKKNVIYHTIEYSIAFEEDTVVMLTKDSQTTLPVTEPEEMKDSLNWTSSNEKVAVVDENGKVTAKTYGTTVITASYSENPDLLATYNVQALFYDVSDSTQSYYKPVYWGADNGVVAGFNGGEYFGPDDDCTRAQFVTFLWRLAGKPTGTKDVSFPDVDPKANYFRAVKWAVSQGIIGGFKHEGAPATFEPDGLVTRGQVATMLWRYGGRKTPKTGASFKDVKSTDNIYRAVSWGQEVGIIKGYKTGEFAGQFRPDDSCLRQHIVTFLYRYDRDVK